MFETTDRIDQQDLPPMVEQLLLDVVADGFTLYACRGRTEPTALVASYEWDRYIDVVILRGADRTIAARVPKHSEVDIFAPEMVVWAYQGRAQLALRALLHLVHPDHPDAPTDTFPAPRALHIPRHEQRPLLIRPPSPHKAIVRATRLAVAMTSPASDRAAGAASGKERTVR